jgi:hypothetical protein
MLTLMSNGAAGIRWENLTYVNFCWAGIRRHWWLLREAWSHAGEDVLCCEPNQLRRLDVDEERVRHDRVLL